MAFGRRFLWPLSGRIGFVALAPPCDDVHGRTNAASAWMRKSGKVQRLEDGVGGAVPVGCLQPVANFAVGGQRQAFLGYGRSCADAIVPKRLSTLHPCRAM